MTTAAVAVATTGVIDFNFLWQRCGSRAGGRVWFEALVQDLVGLDHPAVGTVEANPGDWGIDAFVGSLLEGSVAIWQAKYFIDAFGETQKAEVRDSYKSAQKAAEANGYRLHAWTLAIPRSLDGPAWKWWDRWKKGKEKADGVTIELWHEVTLRRKLMAEEAQDIYRHYFAPQVVVTVEDPTPRQIQRLGDHNVYENALFVEQMRASGSVDFRSAKEEFFNAEILAREITDKAVSSEISTLRNWEAALFSIWSHRFNAACEKHATDRLPGLLSEVMDSVTGYHPNVPRQLGALPLHGYGIMHQTVDAGEAGWVRSWLEVAHGYHQRQTNAQLGDGTLSTASPLVSATEDNRDVDCSQAQ